MRDRWRRAIALSAAVLGGLIELVALQGRRGLRGAPGRPRGRPA